MEQRPQTVRPQNVRLTYTTHGTSTSNHPTHMFSPWNEDPNHPTPMFNPWNEDLKLASNSHVQPMEQRPQTSIQLPHTTHGMKASNHPTPMYNPWNEDLKPVSDSHIVDSVTTTTMLLILNQLQFKNHSVGLKERLSPVYQVLTMTRQN